MANTNSLSFRKEFEDWLREYKTYEESTVTHRVNNVERIERAYGSLPQQWNQDNFESILDELTYTKKDQARYKKYTGKLEISGDLYTCLATYRSALNLYSAFLSHKKSGEVGYPFGEIGERVHNALTYLSNNATKKKSYDAGDVRELIIHPLLTALNTELAPLGYNFDAEKVAAISNNKKATKDRYDIFGKAEGRPLIIIEADTHRGDQVSKKIVSRMSFNPDSEVLYVALVYPNNHQNKDSEKKECEKYFQFINILFASFAGPQKHFMSHWLFK
ncbi:MAG: hypothetical protein K2I64_04595 [Muribaculaceae bacterium]|nr:hypothetical protein [Muribaculaceae bacterium]